MSEHLYRAAAQVLRATHFGNLATVAEDGRPWNCPVMMVVDAGLNLYWFSDTAAQHSRNLRANKNVFITIYDSTVAVGKKLDHGLYFEAAARELTDAAEITCAQELLRELDPRSPYRLSPDSSRRAYKATPTRLWINDIEKQDGAFARDHRVELSLIVYMSPNDI